MKITIKQREIEVKYTLRALFIYEQITGKIFKMETIMEQYIFIYCLLLANCSNLQLTFDEFIELCDSDTELMIKLQQFLLTEINKQSLFLKDSTDSTDKKKEN